jgi:hypothetical protein
MRAENLSQTRKKQTSFIQITTMHALVSVDQAESSFYLHGGLRLCAETAD